MRDEHQEILFKKDFCTFARKAKFPTMPMAHSSACREGRREPAKDRKDPSCVRRTTYASVRTAALGLGHRRAVTFLKEVHALDFSDLFYIQQIEPLPTRNYAL